MSNNTRPTLYNIFKKTTRKDELFTNSIILNILILYKSIFTYSYRPRKVPSRDIKKQKQKTDKGKKSDLIVRRLKHLQIDFQVEYVSIKHQKFINIY